MKCTEQLAINQVQSYEMPRSPYLACDVKMEHSRNVSVRRCDAVDKGSENIGVINPLLL